jgi:hypothetical protein
MVIDLYHILPTKIKLHIFSFAKQIPAYKL